MGEDDRDRVKAKIAQILETLPRPVLEQTYRTMRARGVASGYGTDTQKQRWLPGMCDGSVIAVNGMTEPGTGSDAFAMQTRAVRDGDGWRITGNKTFNSNGPVADVALVFALTDPAKGYHGGVTAFLVPRDTPGFKPGQKFEKMGLRTSSMAEVVVEKDTPGLLFASATWHFSTETLPAAAAEGGLFTVRRAYFRRLNEGGEWVLRPLAEGERLAVGDQLEVHLSLTALHAAEYVHLRDPRGAGFEPETLTSGYRWDLGLARYEEIRDSGTNFFIEWLPAGEYTLKHRLRAATAGVFRAGPATLQSMYAPEFTAYSSGAELAVAGE